MITPAGNFRIFLVTQPVDFRKGMDGLAGHVAEHFDCGADLPLPTSPDQVDADGGQVAWLPVIVSSNDDGLT